MVRYLDPSDSVFALWKRMPPPANALQEGIYREQQVLVVKQQLAMGLINIFNGLLVAVGAAAKAPLGNVAIWYTPILLMGLIQIASWARLRNAPPPEKVSGSYLRKAELAALFIGIVWGSATFFLRGTGDTAHLFFIWMMQAGMAAGLASMLSSVPRVTARFAFACLIPVTVINFSRGGDYALTIALLSLVFLAALVHGSINGYRQLKSLVSTVHDSSEARENLADAIESSNDAFAFYNADREIMIANARHRNWFGTGDPEFELGEESIPVLQKSGRWLMRSTRETGSGGAVVVHTDITALKTRERELIEAQREAVEADAAKSRFLSTMSHELRTPMNIILGFSKLMNGDSKIRLSDADIREYADNIHSSGTHLLKLINDIIDYSKVGLDRITINPTEIDTASLLTESITLAAGFESKSSLDNFDVRVSSRLAKINVDETAIKRILINLITNAIRFNREDCKVVIRAGVNPEGQPFIAIRDFGPGIPENKLERVFEAFYQGDSDLDRQYGGTGLGLTLCRHLARLLSGDIVLKSRLGVGTTSILVLPVSVMTGDTASKGSNSVAPSLPDASAQSPQLTSNASPIA
ncbi:ATP-binding protein [Henriciella sp.]|uniref:sensor histidine kinase n=1 Tax=Henriciella sp. TaxID=1968823 RepID=UPI00261A625A|nr:ATP-binding protein [Henriciella sp.]